MRLVVYQCDVCGRRKGDANHWFLIFPGVKECIIRPWDATFSNHGMWSHICGDECLHKKLQEFLTSCLTSHSTIPPIGPTTKSPKENQP